MEENRNPIPEETPKVPFVARGAEFIFGGVIMLLAIFMCNFVLYGGFHLAFGLVGAAAIGCSWLYLHKTGVRLGRYEKTLLILSLVICLGFGRSNDGFVKFIMLIFLFVAVNLALCIGAGQNRRSPDTATSLMDAPRSFFRLGMGNLGKTAGGLAEGFHTGGEPVRRIGAVGTGLLISVPVLMLMVTLLMNADAAFEGLMDLLPEIELEEYIHSALWGFFLGWILYSRGLSLARADRPVPASRKNKGMNPMTVNTVLIMVCLVYVVYLLSQLAYFAGGLSGILPEGYTLSEYARRGFFEMAWLCVINLSILCFALWQIRQEKLPRLTKIAGTFLGAITVFLVITASAKMLLYIGAYGLTRLRILTQVIMLWLALTTVLVTLRLFKPNFGYMKAVVLTAMILGTLIFWVDVNTVVASYNVKAYQSGKLETVDVGYLNTLGSASTPWLIELTQDDDPEVAKTAQDILEKRSTSWNYIGLEDFRGWNYSLAHSRDLLIAEYWFD